MGRESASVALTNRWLPCKERERERANLATANGGGRFARVVSSPQFAMRLSGAHKEGRPVWLPFIGGKLANMQTHGDWRKKERQHTAQCWVSATRGDRRTNSQQTASVNNQPGDTLPGQPMHRFNCSKLANRRQLGQAARW